MSISVHRYWFWFWLYTLCKGQCLLSEWNSCPDQQIPTRFHRQVCIAVLVCLATRKQFRIKRNRGVVNIILLPWLEQASETKSENFWLFFILISRESIWIDKILDPLLCSWYWTWETRKWRIISICFKLSSNLQQILRVRFEAGLTGEIDEESQVETDTQPEKHLLSASSKYWESGNRKHSRFKG